MPTSTIAPPAEAEATHIQATGGSLASEAPKLDRSQDGASAEASRIRELEAELQQYRELVGRVAQVTAEAAQGNLEARILHSASYGPLQTIAVSVNHMLDMTDAFLREAGAALEHASQGKFFRRVILRGMRGTFRHKSQLINDATETMGRNAASFNEVERLISNSAQMSQEAVHQASTASEVVRQLGQASERIGNFVQSISQIAWQTKLLAFNAKIEASRAGEAGRGFEVVAQEVKELAQQTAAATDDISREIKAIREEVERTSQVMETVSKTIGEMQEISVSVEEAVAERKRNRQGERNS